MFAYTAPAGAPLFSGLPLPWQELQFAAASGEAATWHVWQAGPIFVDGGEVGMSWQLMHPGYVVPAYEREVVL
jgi:hypothetical protein